MRLSFRSQGIMKRLGARITRLNKGLVEISAQNRPDLSQQDGFVHAGVLATLLDTAGGYAVLSLLPVAPEFLPLSSRSISRDPP